jgi:integrase
MLRAPQLDGRPSWELQAIPLIASRGHWVDELGLDRADYGTHSMRRTKATLIYRRTKNLRAVQLLLGHSKLESTVRYLGIEVDDALEISEQTEI